MADLASGAAAPYAMVLGSHVFPGGVPSRELGGAAGDGAPALSRGAGAADHRLRRRRPGIRRARRHGRLAGGARRRRPPTWSSIAAATERPPAWRTRRRSACGRCWWCRRRYHLPRALYLAQPRRDDGDRASRPASSRRTMVDRLFDASARDDWPAPRSSSRSRCAACAGCRPTRFRPRPTAELHRRGPRLQTAPRLVRNGRMRNLALPAGGRVAAARARRLRRAGRRTNRPPTIWRWPSRTSCRRRPTPRYPVNADLDGKVVFLGLDVEPLPAEPGKDLKLTQYWKVVTAPGDGWKTFTHVEGPSKQNYINADHVADQGEVPGRRLEGGRHHPRHAHRAGCPTAGPTRWSRSTSACGAAPRGCRSRRGRTTPRGASWRRRSRCARSNAAEPRKRYVARMTHEAAQARRQARRRGLGRGAVDRARSSTR